MIRLKFLGDLLRDGNREIFRVSLESVTRKVVSTRAVIVDCPHELIMSVPEEKQNNEGKMSNASCLGNYLHQRMVKRGNRISP